MAATSVGSKNSFLERLPRGYDEAMDGYPKLARSTMRLLLLTLFYLVFLVIGASIFSAIESPGEVAMIREVAEIKRNFVEDHECISTEEFDELLIELLKAHDRGVSAVRNASSTVRNWSFGQSFFFSGTIITTIGYGHVAPLSEGGKLFCVIYGLMGIPLTLILLSAYVERLHRPTTSLLRLVHEKFSHLYQPFHIRIIHLAAIGGVIFVTFFVIPAMVFQRLEPQWTFLDGLYYCFISLTTIGLGDYVPGDSPDQEYRTLYKILVTAYLMVGLTFMMLLLSLFSEIPQLNFGLWFLIKSEEAGAALPFSSYTAGSGSNHQPDRASRSPGGTASAAAGPGKGSSSSSTATSGAMLQKQGAAFQEPTASTALLSGSSLSSTTAGEKAKQKGSPAAGGAGSPFGSNSTSGANGTYTSGGTGYYQAEDPRQQLPTKRTNGGNEPSAPAPGSQLNTSTAQTKTALGRTTSSASSAGYSSTAPPTRNQQQYPPTNPFGAAASATSTNTSSPFYSGSSTAPVYGGSPFGASAPTSFPMTTLGPSGQITQKVRVKSRPIDSPSPDDPDQILDLK